MAYASSHPILIWLWRLSSHITKHAGTNGKLKWKAIKEGLLLESERCHIEEINYRGVFTKSDEQIAEAFKDHFENCATRLSEGGVTRLCQCPLVNCGILTK